VKNLWNFVESQWTRSETFRTFMTKSELRAYSDPLKDKYRQEEQAAQNDDSGIWGTRSVAAV